jgi:5'-deoxynucleotidase YfbR-like HD superfamily hydrolase
MSEADHIHLDIRLAGLVRRYHTWPVIGQQNVAEHSWQLLRIYLNVVDKIDSNLVFHIMFHDIGEQTTGDLPYPIKRNNPPLKEIMDLLEQKACYSILEHWGCFRQTLLTSADMILFKQIELVEMAEFGLDQLCLGNNHGYIIAHRCLRAVFEQHPCPRLAEYVITRLDIFYKQCATVFAYDTVEDWWLMAQWEKLNDSEPETSRRTALQDNV